MTYEEILESRTPYSSRNGKSDEFAASTKTDVDLDMHPVPEFNRSYKSPKQASAKVVPPYGGLGE